MHTFQILSNPEIEAIHQASLRILNETGITLTHPGGRDLLAGNGAIIRDKAGFNQVLLPPELVESCLKDLPHQVSLRGRGDITKTLGDGSLYFHNLGGARDIYDPGSKIHRYATLEDLRMATRLLDALPNCHTITPFFTPQDIPGLLEADSAVAGFTMSLSMYRYALPHTTKPLQGPGVQTAQEVRYITQMAEVIGNPSQNLSLSVSPVSPLGFPDHEVGAILEIARRGISFAPLPCPTAGMTAPFSIAGALALQNAEILASIVLAQLTRPGLPVIYCGRLAMMEPRTGASVWGGVELGLASAGTVQIGHRYGLPVNVYGFSTNAHGFDVQNGYERALNALLPALAGADELSGIGEMEAGVLSSFAQMVIDDELAASIQRARRGFEVNEEALAVDVVAEIMKGKRNFIDQKHTVRYLRSGEVFITKLAERGAWESWTQAGQPDLAARAQAEAERILREHQVVPLEPSQEKELDAILIAAGQEFAGH